MTPYGTTIFCDDIRTEDNGKNIYIGVYEDAMVLPSDPPAILPVFSMAIKVLEPVKDRGANFNIKIISCSDFSREEAAREVIFEIDLPDDRWQIIDKADFDEEAEFICSVFVLRMNGFTIPHVGYIRVRGYRNDEEYKLGSLRVMKAS